MSFSSLLVRSSEVLLKTDKESFQKLSVIYDAINDTTHLICKSMVAFLGEEHVESGNPVTKEDMAAHIRSLGIELTPEIWDLLAQFAKICLDHPTPAKFIGYMSKKETKAGKTVGIGGRSFFHRQLISLAGEKDSAVFIQKCVDNKTVTYSQEKLEEIVDRVIKHNTPILDVLKEYKDDHRDPGEAIGLKLRDMGVFPCFPAGKTNKIYDICWLLGLRRIKSWFACNELHKKLLENEKQAIENLSKEVDFALVRRTNEFMQECIDNDVYPGKKFLRSAASLIKRAKEAESKNPIVERLRRYPEIFDENVFPDLVKIWDLQRKLDRKQNMIGITYPGDNSPVYPEFDSVTSSIATAEEIFQFTFKKNDFGLTAPLIVASYQSGYFINPTIIPNGNNYIFKYLKGNSTREKITGEIKSFRLVRRKGRFYACMTHYINSEQESKYKQSTNSKFHFLTNRSKKSKHEVPPKTRVLSVDINHSPLLACSVLELDKKDGEISFNTLDNRDVSLVKSFNIGEKLNPRLFQDINNLRNRAKKIPAAIRIHKNQAQGKELREGSLEFLESSGLNNSRDVGTEVGKIVKEYRRINAEIAWKPGLFAELIALLDLIDTIRSMVISWNRHKEFEWLPTDKKEGESYRRRMRNLADDVLKKVCFALSQAARENNCSLIVLEDLGFNSEEGEKYFNRLNQIWSMMKVADRLEWVVAPYGIAVAQVDPRGTSRRDPMTDEIGYRCKFDKTKLYVEREGKVEVINSDTSASINIGKVFLTRHENVHSIEAFKVDEKTAIVKPMNSEYFKAFLKEKVGSESAIFKKTKDKWILDKDRSVKIPAKKQKLKFYKNGDGWLEKEQHLQRIEQLPIKHQMKMGVK